MIRTFLIYSLLDKCLDLFFDRIEAAFVPFDGYRVGDRFRRIVHVYSLDEGEGDGIPGLIGMWRSHYDCVIENITHTQVVLHVGFIEFVYEFMDESSAKKYMLENPDNKYSFCGNTEIYMTRYVDGVIISRDHFDKMEKWK